MRKIRFRNCPKTIRGLGQTFTISIVLCSILLSSCYMQDKEEADREGKKLIKNLTLMWLVLENQRLQKKPVVRITNANNVPESYTLYKTACTGSPDYTFSNPVTPGNTTSSVTIEQGSYYMNTTILCSSGPIQFSNGNTYLCASNGSTVSCAATKMNLL